jgi:glycosyltransferase involved in cell wall biosynthesis
VIAYIVKMFPRLSETFIQNEILELERRDMRLRLFSLKRPRPETAGAQVRASVIYLPERVYREPIRALRAQWGVLRRYPAGYLRTLAHVLRGRELRSLPRGLRRFCQTCCLVNELEGAVHLHAHFASEPTRLASWARMLCGISFSVSTHAKDLFQDARVDLPGLRYKLSAARFVVANSEFSAARLAASLKGNDGRTSKIVTIYNGIDLSAFTLRQWEPAEPLILSVGRLIEKKGFRQLIGACAGMAQQGMKFECEIVGSGPLKSVLHDDITRLGLSERVRLRGERPHTELLPLYQRARVFALPCVIAANGDRDILPNVLKEAMATGVPVVTTRLEGIEELVTHGRTGVLVPPNDVEALASALRALLENATLRQQLATEARKVIEARFDARKNFAQLKELLAGAAPADAAPEPRVLAPSFS